MCTRTSSGPDAPEYCHEANGWCGVTAVHRDAETSTAYDYSPDHQVIATTGCSSSMVDFARLTSLDCPLPTFPNMVRTIMISSLALISERFKLLSSAALEQVPWLSAQNLQFSQNHGVLYKLKIRTVVSKLKLVARGRAKVSAAAACAAMGGR